jgi:UDP-N-acetylglucosamine 4,6-dehydratase (inverting)
MNINFFSKKTIFITGGTGSFGKAFINFFIKKKIKFKKIIIFSRDELKQHEMKNLLNENNKKKIRFFLGDIREKDRLKRAIQGVDFLIHAAALKQVPTAEYNPFEFIKTNILGTQNVVESCLDSNVQKVILLSTDKASSPINLYGATKLCADKLFVSANNIKGSKKIFFSVVRYGNVMGSRGSVLHEFVKQKENKKIYLTHENMTRFNISLDKAVETVLWAFKNCKGGEIVVPKIPSFYVKNLAKAVCDKSKIVISGIRPGEKMHEEMISLEDSINTVSLKKYYLILPKTYIFNKGNNFIKKEFSYNSLNNKDFLNANELRNIIKKELIIT